jgi:hypothetical protein
MPRTRRIPANYRPLARSERPPHPKTRHLGAADVNETAQIQLIDSGGPALKDLDYFQRTPINARKLPLGSNSWRTMGPCPTWWCSFAGAGGLRRPSAVFR